MLAHAQGGLWNAARLASGLAVSGHALRNNAQKIVCEHERVRLALANLYPDLVA
jgi:hypothetical protein